MSNAWLAVIGTLVFIVTMIGFSLFELGRPARESSHAGTIRRDDELRDQGPR